MKAQPPISLCIPVYNGSRYIANTLNSAFAQTFGDFELIVCDNASTDDSLEIAKSYHDKRIVIHKNESNIGAAANFNKCLEIARGSFIKILCADDQLYPDCLEEQYGIMRSDKHGNICMVSCRRDIIDPNGAIRLRPNPFRFQGLISSAIAIRSSVRSGTNLIGEPMAVLFRTDLGRRVGGFDPSQSFCLDIDFWFRLLKLGNLFRINKSLCAFRVTNTSWSTAIAARQQIEYRTFLESLIRNTDAEFTELDAKMGVINAHLGAMYRRLFYKWLDWTCQAELSSSDR